LARNLLLEVIACTVEDAIQAEYGGADRLEIVSHLEVGGLTPPLSMVREILKAVSIPVRVMLRGNDGFETGSQKEISDLCDVAGELHALRVDGIVVGLLRDGKIDVEAISQILASAPELNATFHHAFDASDNPLQSIETLKSFTQVDRILTRGSDESLALQVSNLTAFETKARPQIRILAGGGLDASRIRELVSSTPVSEFHVGRAVRVPQETQGEVRAESVRELLSAQLVGFPEQISKH